MYEIIKLYKNYIIYTGIIIIETILAGIFFDNKIIAIIFMFFMYFYVEWGGELYGRLSMQCILIEDAGDSDSFHRVNKLFENVKKKVEMKFSYLPNIKLYYIPSDEINAFSFGRKSIGITEGAMRLDDNLLKAVLSHEIGHSIHGDMFLYRILFGNLVVVFLLISIWNFIFIGVIMAIGFIIFVILSFRCNYVTYRLSNILITTLQKLLSGMKYIIFKIGEAIIACVSRQSEFKADEFAFLLGYGRYLCLFLEKYGCKINYHPRSIEEIVYSSHPDTYKRISRLKNLIRGFLK